MWRDLYLGLKTMELVIEHICLKQGFNNTRKFMFVNDEKFAQISIHPAEDEVGFIQEVFRECYKCRVFKNTYVSGKCI